jgi:hypothetical protein
MLPGATDTQLPKEHAIPNPREKARKHSAISTCTRSRVKGRQARLGPWQARRTSTATSPNTAIPEENYPAAFALWIAEVTGGPVPRFEKDELLGFAHLPGVPRLEQRPGKRPNNAGSVRRRG